MFIHTFTIPNLETSDGRVIIEVRERSLNTVTYSMNCAIGALHTTEFGGAKYDNDLEYRYLDSATNEPLTSPKPLSDGGVSAALNRLDPGSRADFDYAVLDGVSHPEMIYLMRNILIRGYQKVLLNPSKPTLARYNKFLNNFPATILEEIPVVQYVHQLLSILVRYVERCLARERPVEILDEVVIDRMTANYCRSFGLDVHQAEQEPGLLVAKGHIASLNDRGLASSCYDRARAYGHDFIESFLRTDGLTTYFAEVPKTAQPAIFPGHAPDGYLKNRRNICFSVDPKYFRMYGPSWAATSSFYPNINFNYLIITDTREEFERLANEYRNILKSTNTFIGRNSNPNVRLYWMPNNKSYGKTLYACARFFLAEHLLRHSTGDVFVCDVDQLVVADLEKFLVSTARADSNVQLAVVENYYALLPGRSHLAGYVYLKNSDISRGFLRNVVEYIEHGLGREYSWMLDQNAIRYGSETTLVRHLDLRSTKIFGHYPTHKNSLRANLPAT